MAGEPDNGRAPRLAMRLVWFVALWLAGVAAVAALALVIRQLL